MKKSSNQNKTVKKLSKDLADEGLGVHFCTECNEELEDVSVKEDATFEAALNRHEECKKTGKFNGELCSRIFIMSNNLIDINPKDED